MQNKDNPNLFKEGLNKESVNIGHPEDSPSFALNANIDGFRGNGFRYQTEPGNEECYFLPEGYSLIGKIYIADNTLAVFSTDNINSEIGLVKDCHYEVIYNNPCLNFNTKYPISGQARIRKGCERTIYWNDYFNPDRYLNIDEFLSCKEIDCELLNFNPEVNSPCIELVRVNNQGGSLELGTYSIGVEILDKNENMVFRSDLSRKIPIVDESLNDSYELIDGGYNLDTYSAEIGGLPKTNKSITFQVSNLDAKFSFLRVFVRRSITGDGIVTDSHVLGNLIPITSDTVTFTYSGFSAFNGDFMIPNSETVIPKIIYDRSRSMEQVQNRLLRANISEPYVDVSEYQKSASKIYSEWVLKPTNSEEVENSPKDPNTYWLDSTFMDDEIYSFGIGFELDTGYKTPIFHIPGIGMNKIIIDGDCLDLEDIPNESILEKCLYIEGIATVLGFPESSCQMIFTYTINFNANGSPLQSSGSFTIKDWTTVNPFKEKIYCVKGDVEITDVVIELIANFNCPNQGETVELEYNWEIKAEYLQHIVENDTKIVEVWIPDLIPFTDLTEEEYNDLPNEEKFQYWQIYNTAAMFEDGLSGRMSYHQCNEALYLAPDSCCIEDYWGYDYCGTKLEGTSIRHHRFPCKGLIPPEGYKLGIRFYNVEYPDSKVVSHFFVVGERTPENMTVLDQGMGGNLGKDDTYTAFSFLFPTLGTISPGPGFADCESTLNLDEEAFWYMTPRMVFNKEYLNGAYIKMLRTIKTTNAWSNVMDISDLDPQTEKTKNVFGGIRVFCYGNYLQNTGKTYYAINNNFILSPYQEFYTSTKKYANISRVNRIGIIETDDLPHWGSRTLALFSIKSNKDVYCNLDSIVYKKMHNCNLTINEDNSYDVFGGDSFLSKMDVWNHFFWKINPSYWKAIFVALAATLIAVGAAIITGGGAIPLIGAGITALAASLGLTITVTALLVVALSALTVLAVTNEMINTHNDHFVRGLYKNFLCDDDLNNQLDKIDPDLSAYTATVSEAIRNVQLTSIVNSELRHYGFGECYTGFKIRDEEICDSQINQGILLNFLRSRLYYYDDEAKEIKIRELFCPEYYGYNKDYSLIYGEKNFFSVPRNFDFCRSCNNEFKNTIIYSDKSFDTEDSDKFLVYKINNAIDVPAHRGEIFNLKHKSNVLYILCKETTFLLQPNPQIMKTDKDIVTLGTGDFLSLPSQELIQTDVGYGGCQSTTCLNNSEHGFPWVDQSKGEVYNIGQGLEEISQIKMEPWFKENLPSVFNKVFFDTFHEEYPYMNSITDSIGLGMVCVYDPKHERLIIHKKDYKPKLPLSQDLTDPTEDKLFFNGSNFFTNKNQQSIILSFEDKKYFENKSWTTAYSLKYKKWIGYYSYLPTFMYNDRNFYYTTDNNKIYKHLHNGKYLNFYESKFPFIIEGIHTTLQTSDLHAFHYITTAEEFNIDKDVFILKPKVTFNQAYFYNLDETTGLLNLRLLDLHTNPYGNIDLPENTKSIIMTDENYKISGLRDVSIASPVTSRKWEDIEAYFNIDSSRHGYIDQVPINFDFNTGTFNLKDLNDKLITYRLIYNPTDEDIRLSLVYQSNFTFISNR